ncbi:MAG: glycosyltransferase family 4 protein [Bacteroidales bacterium]|jgi:glycosyltransferase involved in cell wall biosynthesis|nr:glycosyltransferase family 4 protein [Bacteroidales bacterium]
MKIGIIIGRIGGVDGVALETEKWIEVFQKMGHQIFIISGQFEGRKMNCESETRVPEMSFFSPESYWEQKKAFFHPDFDQDDLIEHLQLYSKVIENKIINWIHKFNIDLLLSENASCLPSHISMGIAIKNAILKTGKTIITHDHDFAWERGDRYVSPHPKINEFVKNEFPLRLPNSYHAVINLNARKTLKEKFNRDSIVVPNVMNFDKPFGELNENNKNLLIDLNLENNDILLFQITRVVERKGIETAIDLIDKLHDPRLKLIITGNYADDAGNLYYMKLVEQIHELKLSKQIRFAYQDFSNKGLSGHASKNYSLSDAYAYARACTYFSTYEGFGNAFVEAVLAKRPIFVNNYKPVYWPDIGSKGFKAVMLEDNVLTNNALKDMHEVIYNTQLNKEIAEYNYQLGKKLFSYVTLEEKLRQLIDIATK